MLPIPGGKMGAVDFAKIFAAIPPQATARGLSLALAPICGTAPAVVDYGTYYQIEFSADQETRLSEWVISQLRKDPGPVRVDAGAVAVKVITRQYWPVILGLIGVGAVAGYMARKGR